MPESVLYLYCGGCEAQDTGTRHKGSEGVQGPHLPAGLRGRVAVRVLSYRRWECKGSPDPCFIGLKETTDNHRPLPAGDEVLRAPSRQGALGGVLFRCLGFSLQVTGLPFNGTGFRVGLGSK